MLLAVPGPPDARAGRWTTGFCPRLLDGEGAQGSLPDLDG